MVTADSDIGCLFVTVNCGEQKKTEQNKLQEKKRPLSAELVILGMVQAFLKL